MLMRVEFGSVLDKILSGVDRLNFSGVIKALLCHGHVTAVKQRGATTSTVKWFGEHK